MAACFVTIPRFFAAVVLCAIAGLNMTACTELPEERYIEYTRLLGLKATVESSPLRPITPNARRPYAEALPFETLRLQAYIASPLGEISPARLRSRWIVCEQLPDTPVGGCLRNYISAKDPVLDTLTTCPDPAQNPNATDPDGARTAPCFLPINQDPELFTVPFSVNMLLGGGLEFWYIASLREGPGVPACIRTLLEGESELDDNCLYGVTTAPVGPKNLLQDILAQLGVDPQNFPGTSLPAPGGDNAKPVEGNRHPAIALVTYTIESNNTAVTPPRILEPGTVIDAPLGSTLRFEISLPEAELQTYPVPVNDGESVVVRTEEYINNWFYTWGSLEIAEDKADLAAERWVLVADEEQEQPPKQPGDMVFAYFAVRDDRGGIDWRSFEVRLLEPLPAPPPPQAKATRTKPASGA